MKKILSVILLFPVSLYCFSQKNMEKGFIVKNNGEQVLGLIDIQTNVVNSKSCIFQNEEAGTLENFTPEDIRAYKTSSKYYISREIEIDSIKQKVFLEYLVDGIVDLYYLRDNINEYYFIEKEGQLHPLENNSRQVLVEGSGFDHNNRIFDKNSNQYKGALNYLFSDAQGLSPKISQAPFRYKSLINLTKDYHDAVCSEYECIDYTKSTVQRFLLELSAGMSYSEMHLKTSDHIETNITPVATAQLRFVPLKGNSNWAFLVGISYSSNDFHGLYENDLFYYVQDDTFDIDVKYIILRVPLTIQYEVGSGKVQPVFSIGYNASFYLGAEYAVFGHWENHKYPKYSYLSRFQHGFTGGLGLKYNLSDSKYFFLKSMYEYRVPTSHVFNVLEYLRYHNILINFGFAFKL